MNRFRLCFLLAMLACLATPLRAASKTQVRLVLPVEVARPGETFTAALELDMPKGWHTYWRFSGESGIATSIAWQLPPGIEAGPIQWPVPEKAIEEGLPTYVLHGKAALLVNLKLATNLASGTYELKGSASWLECEKQCVPGGGKVQAVLKVGAESKPSSEAGLIESALKRLPAPAPAGVIEAKWENGGAGDDRPLLIEWKGQTAGFEFFPDGSEAYEVKGETVPAPGGKGIRKIIHRSEKTAWPGEIKGVIAAVGTAGPAYEVVLRPEGAGTAVAQTSVAGPTGTGAAPKGKESLLAMLGLAFIGGLILNIMPCVLPVIALKILGFVAQSRDNPTHVRKMGVIYTMGVLTSFLVLAGFVIAVQQAGKAANWGMQFQNPQFLVVMTVLVTLVALNLFGVFEVTLAGGAMGAAGNLAAKEGPSGAFFNGVLATALATPCTAPFLAIALGFAFAQPPGIIVLMFCTIGAGLAAPYLILSWRSEWLRFLPRPGVWMEKFKNAMGFPMLATAIWMFWLASQHFGKSGVLWLGIFLVALSMSVWIWGEFVQRSRKRPGLAMAFSLLILVSGYAYALEGELKWRHPAVVADSSTGGVMGANGLVWGKWSPEAVVQARAAGHPVLVDFTADWCLTCQVNKKSSIEIAEVANKLKEIGAVALLGDHTKIDPRITAELAKYERAGVPLVLVFPADPSAEAIVLPEILKPSIVLDALGKAGVGPKVKSTERTSIPWGKWSPEAVRQARESGHPVLVDFTADWCFTCQLNKRRGLDQPEVSKKLAEVNGVALMADYTGKDPLITAEISRSKRSGVPLVLVYPPDPASEPIVLPVMLRPNVVTEALSLVASKR